MDRGIYLALKRKSFKNKCVINAEHTIVLLVSFKRLGGTKNDKRT